MTKSFGGDWRLEQLQYLLAIHENQSINLAGAELHVSQQSISKAIQNLEQELQVSLLERSNKGAVLTPEGRVVLRHAKRIFSEIDSLHDEFQKIHKESSPLCGTLRVLYNNSFDYSLMIFAVEAYRADHPKVQFFLQQRTLANILSFLNSGAADVGLFSIASDFHINTLLAPEKLASLDTLLLSKDAMLVAVSNDSPLSKQHSITLRTVLKHPIVFYLNEADGGTEFSHNWMFNYLTDHGEPNIAMTMNTLNPYLDAIASNIGIRFLTRSSTRILPKASFENITLIPLRPALSLDSICMTPSGGATLPLIQSFLPYLTNAFK